MKGIPILTNWKMNNSARINYHTFLENEDILQATCILSCKTNKLHWPEILVIVASQNPPRNPGEIVRIGWFSGRFHRIDLVYLS